MIKALSLGNGVSLSFRLGCMLESVEQHKISLKNAMI